MRPAQGYVARLNSDGSNDQSFGDNGFFFRDFVAGDNDAFNSIQSLPDGRIIASGYAGSGFSIARLLPGGSVLVTPRSATTTEAGTTTQFDVVLDSVPTSNVIISLSASILGEGSLSTNTLMFTPGTALSPADGHCHRR